MDFSYGLICGNISLNSIIALFAFLGKRTRRTAFIDVGNFIWGNWSRHVGLTNSEVWTGSNANELISSGKMDTPADQTAVFNGRKVSTQGN